MISVCMACYNGENYVQEQLESILCQIGPEDEVIIVDDVSTDRTQKIIREFEDERIKIFQNEKRLGPVFNFEQALKYAKGDYIFLSDQDDVWLKGKVKKVMTALLNYDLVFHNAVFRMEQDCVPMSEKTLFEWRNVKRGVFQNLYKNSYTGCCMAFKKKVLRKSIPFPKNIAMHDEWISIIAEQFFSVQFLEEPLLEYRRHEGNVTQLGSDKRGPYWKMFANRFWYAYYLFLRVWKVSR